MRVPLLNGSRPKVAFSVNRSIKSKLRTPRAMASIFGRVKENEYPISRREKPNARAMLDHLGERFGSSKLLQHIKKGGEDDCWEVLGKLICNNSDVKIDLKHFALLCVLYGTAIMVVEPVHAAESKDQAMVLADLAENSDFWANVLRYISYFFSVLLGTAYVAVKPVAELLRRPRTAVLVIAAAVLLYLFVSTTVSAMLGLNDLVDYEPSSIVTPPSR